MVVRRFTRTISSQSGLQIFSQVEWPTLALAILIYGGWLAATYWHALLPWPVRIACGGWLIAWQGSLQHEAIHGHPTRSRRVNDVIAALPLCLWLPYAHYRRSHLAHHATLHLTLPGHDPESRYLSSPPSPPGRMRRWARAATATLAGRLLIGPALEIVGFLGDEAVRLTREPRARRIWAAHLALVGMVLAWVVGVCRMSLAEYLLVFVYPGAALSLLRSFAEHRADPDPARRVATVEHAPLFGLLFLNSNLHVAHHRAPSAPWYRLPALHRNLREEVLASGAPVYEGYFQIAARYLFRPHDRLTHPAFEADGPQ